MEPLLATITQMTCSGILSDRFARMFLGGPGQVSVNPDADQSRRPQQQAVAHCSLMIQGDRLAEAAMFPPVGDGNTAGDRNLKDRR